MLSLLKVSLLFGSFFIYSYLFIVLLFSNLNNRRTKVTLCLFMLTASVFFALTVIKYLNYYHVFKYLNNIFWSILLFAFPLLYLYASSLFNRKWFKPLCLLHFSPVVIVFAAGVFIHAGFTIDEMEQYVRLKAAVEQNIEKRFVNLELFAQSVGVIYFLQGILYFGLNYRMFHFHKRRFNDLFSNNLNKDLIRLRIIIYLIFAITVVYNIGVNVVGLDNIWSKDFTVIAVLVLIIFLTASLGIFGARQNSIYDMDTTLLDCEMKQENNLLLLKSKILKLFDNQEIYLNKDLTIWDLCRMVCSNRTYVSRLINQEFNLNFNFFVNQYRIERAKELLKDRVYGEDNLEMIAMKSGFNSLPSFNRAFKRMTNISPGNYRNKMVEQT